MSDKQMPDNVKQDSPPGEAPAAKTKTAKDPVRQWTFIVLGLCVLMMAWYLRSDRVTPITSQAKLYAMVVPIAPEVSGTVASVSVDNNQQVKAGDVLFQIDTSRFTLAEQTALANMESAQQAMGSSRANVDAALASLESAKAKMVQAKQDTERMRSIRKEDPGAISQRRLESSEASFLASEGQVAAAEANVDKARQDMGTLGDQNSRILQAQAALDEARLNLARSTVRAPQDGLITGVNLNPGNYAAAGAPQMTFVATHNIWVQADYKENNLGNIDGGDTVEMVFDVLPGQVFKGRVREMGFGVAVDNPPLGSLPTINNDRDWLRDAQRFPVLIDLDLSALESGRTRLKVGSQVTVVVYTGEHWLSNALARVYIRIAAFMTYAY